MAKDLYSPAQLAALTGLAVGNQRNWRRDGFFREHGVQGAGGYWKFTKYDVLYVAAVRALAERGVGLGAAGALVENCLLEIEGAITGVPRIVAEHHKYAFVWKRDDCTPEAEAGLSKSAFRFERWIENEAFPDALTVHHSGEWCATIINDLDFVPRLSRAGGTIVILSDLPRKIPPAVADLFTASAAQ